MVKPENLKIVTVSFIALSFLAGFIARVIFETLSVAFGFFASLYSMDIMRHGVPLTVGIVAFVVFQFYSPAQKLADDVVTEVRKVVWPGKKELYSMTILVCMILLVSGLVLGVFDWIASTVVQFFMN